MTNDGGTSRHVTHEVVDYLEERLGGQQRATIDAHLGTCQDCAGLYATAATLREDVFASDARHPDLDRLLALGEGTESSADEKRHFARCSLCREHLDGLRRLEPSLLPAGDARTDAPAGWLDAFREFLGGVPRWCWAGATVAIAIATLITSRPPQRALFTDLARREPLEVLWTRGGSEDSHDAYAQGLKHYAAGEWSAAAAELGRMAELEPEHPDVFLYLGSSRLLLGDADGAIVILERAVENAPDEMTDDEARWQLANARVLAGDAGARALLQSILDEGLGRSDDARILLEKLETFSR